MKNLLPAVTALLVLLSGCASVGQQETDSGIAALSRGDLAAAQGHFERAIQNGDPSGWNNLGVVYEHRGLQNHAIQHYTMGARWGVTKAQQNLARLGAPIPAADLAEQKAAQRAREAAAMNEAAKLFAPQQQAPAMPRQVNCESRRIGNQVQTQCW